MRLKPEEWFPAGVDGITVRRLSLASGIAVRALEAGPRDAPKLLLLHGWGVSAYLWRHNILPLASAGHRVVAVDLPGHGQSDAPDLAGGYTLPAFAQWVREVLDALGWPRATIAAQSMAGKIAVRVALDVPDRVTQLQLFGPVGFGLIPPWQGLAPLVPALPGALPAFMVPRAVVAFTQERVRGTIGAPATERDIDEYWAPSQFPDVVRAALRMLTAFSWVPWTQAELARLDVPTLVVFGTRDRTVRPRFATELSRALPRGRLEWIVDGGHVLMEEVPERINAMMLDALAPRA